MPCRSAGPDPPALPGRQAHYRDPGPGAFLEQGRPKGPQRDERPLRQMALLQNIQNRPVLPSRSSAFSQVP